MIISLKTNYIRGEVAKPYIEKVKFDGNGLHLLGRWILWELFGKYMFWYFLSVVTFCIYALIKMPLNLERYEKAHTHILNESYDPVPDAE